MGISTGAIIGMYIIPTVLVVGFLIFYNFRPKGRDKK